ncbi:unnamed protein product, partial [Prorocentrum cordatum]
DDVEQPPKGGPLHGCEACVELVSSNFPGMKFYEAVAKKDEDEQFSDGLDAVFQARGETKTDQSVNHDMQVTEEASLQAALQETHELHTTASCTKKYGNNPKTMKIRPVKLPDARGKMRQFFPIPAANFRTFKALSVVGGRPKTVRMSGVKLFEGHGEMALESQHNVYMAKLQLDKMKKTACAGERGNRQPDPDRELESTGPKLCRTSAHATPSKEGGRSKSRAPCSKGKDMTADLEAQDTTDQMEAAFGKLAVLFAEHPFADKDVCQSSAAEQHQSGTSAYWIARLPLDCTAASTSFKFAHAVSQSEILRSKVGRVERDQLEAHLGLVQEAKHFPDGKLQLLSWDQAVAKIERLKQAGATWLADTRISILKAFVKHYANMADQGKNVDTAIGRLVVTFAPFVSGPPPSYDAAAPALLSSRLPMAETKDLYLTSGFIGCLLQWLERGESMESHIIALCGSVKAHWVVSEDTVMTTECAHLIQDTKKVLAVLSASYMKSLQVDTPASVFDDVKPLQYDGLKASRTGAASSVFQVVGQAVERSAHWNRMVTAFAKSAKALKTSAPALQEHMQLAVEMKDERPSAEHRQKLKSIVEAIPEYNATVGESHVIELDANIAVAISAHTATVASLSTGDGTETAVKDGSQRLLVPYVELVKAAIASCSRDEKLLREQKMLLDSQRLIAQMEKATDLKNKLDEFKIDDSHYSNAMKDYFGTLAPPGNDDASRSLVHGLFERVVGQQHLVDFDGNDVFNHIPLLKSMCQHVPTGHAASCSHVADLLSRVGALNIARMAVERLGDSPYEAVLAPECEQTLAELDRNVQVCKAILAKKVKGFDATFKRGKERMEEATGYLKEVAAALVTRGATAAKASTEGAWNKLKESNIYGSFEQDVAKANWKDICTVWETGFKDLDHDEALGWLDQLSQDGIR